MSVSGITDYFGYNPDAYLEEKSGDELDKFDFLKLIIAQLEYQDPLEPLGSSEFMTQTTAMGQLEQMQNLNANFEEMMTTNSIIGGSQLIGQSVLAVDTDTNSVIQGVVSQVGIEDGNVMVQVGNYILDLDNVLSVTSQTSASSILQASHMIGLNVTALDPDDDLGIYTVSGTVSEASVSGGTIMVKFADSETGEEYEIPLEDILTVGQASANETEEE